MTYAGIALLTLLVGLIDLPGLIHQGRRRELAVAAGLLILGLVAAEIRALGAPMPTIGALMEWLASPIMGQP